MTCGLASYLYSNPLVQAISLAHRLADCSSHIWSGRECVRNGRGMYGKVIIFTQLKPSAKPMDLY